MIRIEQLRPDGGDIENSLFVLKDVQSGGATLLTPQQMQSTLQAFQKDLVARQQQLRAELAVKNQAAGEAFFATNKNNPGIVTLPDGLEYKIITDGSGATPTA